MQSKKKTSDKVLNEVKSQGNVEICSDSKKHNKIEQSKENLIKWIIECIYVIIL